MSDDHHEWVVRTLASFGEFSDRIELAVEQSRLLVAAQREKKTPVTNKLA